MALDRAAQRGIHGATKANADALHVVPFEEAAANGFDLLENPRCTRRRIHLHPVKLDKL